MGQYFLDPHELRLIKRGFRHHWVRRNDLDLILPCPLIRVILSQKVVSVLIYYALLIQRKDVICLRPEVADLGWLGTEDAINDKQDGILLVLGQISAHYGREFIPEHRQHYFRQSVQLF